MFKPKTKKKKKEKKEKRQKEKKERIATGFEHCTIGTT